MGVQHLTAVGRIVWGNPLKPQNKTDNDGKVILKEGQPIPVYAYGLAIPKADFGPTSAAMSQAATGIPGADQPGFAWKLKDGDTALDAKGKPLRDKPGYAGCYVISISTEVRELAQVYKQVSPGNYVAMGPEEIKTGDYVRTKLDIVGHGAAPGVRGAKAGLYLNPLGTEFVGYGEAIFSGPDANEMFGGAPAPALPPGASATPTPSGNFPGAPTAAAPMVPTAAAPGPVPGNPTPGFAPGAAPVPASPAGPVPTAPGPTAFPSSGPVPTPAAAPVPAHDVVAAAMPGGIPQPAPSPAVASPAAPAAAPGAMGRTPVGFHQTTGRPIYGYTPDANGQQWPIYGFNPDGSPIYQ